MCDVCSTLEVKSTAGRDDDGKLATTGNNLYSPSISKYLSYLIFISTLTTYFIKKITVIKNPKYNT
jgi:hypothetical protein